MPSFDITSITDVHEVTNAIDQTNREISTRFDFKDSNAKVTFDNKCITVTAPSEFQVKQVDDIMRQKLGKRQIDIRVLHYQKLSETLKEAKQMIDLRQGIEQEQAKKITKLVKDSGLKVQTAIQGDQIRVTGKKKDDLQEVMSLLRGAKVEIPLQFENFRD